MRRAAPLLLLAVLTAAANNHSNTTADSLVTNTFVIDDANARITIDDANGTVVLRDNNGTIIELDADQAEVVRKKRTFGDVVFRGLADVLGYNVQRKPPQAFEFPPPVAPVPGIDTPLAAPAAAPAPAPAPCGQPRAAPPPCRPPPPPPPPPPPAPKAVPPCPRPRAVPRPKPRPKTTPRPPPPPPPPPPCARPRAAPATPAPCAPPPPPPKQQADTNLERITSNLRLNFNFNRSPLTQAPAAAEAVPEDQVDTQEDDQDQYVPIAIQPQAAKLPLDEPRKPRVYVDAFVVQNGIAKRVDTVDAKRLNNLRETNEDYLAYDDENTQQQLDDDYEDVQESRDREAAVRQAVDAEDDSEVTTTTEDPKKSLKPRILPPTEHNPNQIDTVTVRVPPIYREKRPKKLHRERPETPDRDEEDDERHVTGNYSREREDEDSDGYDSLLTPQTERPRRKRRRKQSRKTRSTDKSDESENEEYSVDYFGKKIPVSEEEKFYMRLRVPEPTVDPDVARHESPVKSGYFLEDHERLREDPKHRIADDEKDNDDSDDDDESERSDSTERTTEDKERSGEDERSGENERANEHERTDKLRPNARVRESGYQNKYVTASNVRVDEPETNVASVKRKTVKLGQGKA
ncbi:unnamed protein product [Arctia plantaginis]|uniref:Uncharacterized protein n=1 Tax=Arctia plantaginis TaxID=874455 RepID=A0A8S0Z5K7_ARCPL|nr:unnamed protein product [Arctia plantaginis]